MIGYLLVRADECWYGIPLPSVRQVSDRGAVFPVPSVHEAVVGVTSNGERLVPLIDLGTLLAGTAAGAPQTRATVVLTAGGGAQLALAVDHAEAVIRETPEPAPPGWRVPWASAVARRQGRLIPVLDIDRLVERLSPMGVDEAS